MTPVPSLATTFADDFARRAVHQACAFLRSPSHRLSRIASVAALLMVSTANAQFTPCGADLNGDGVVDGADLGVLLDAWGSGPGQADLNGDGVVDGADLGLLLSAWGSKCESGDITAIKLAGTPINGFPDFRPDLAFNIGSDIWLSIDPIRFPEIVGQPAQIYVVASRDAASYESDPTLTDVRPGGPQQVVFGATTIGTTFQIDAGQLPAGSGTDLGALYDVIVDFDFSGTLSAGDFIDGLDGPGFAVVRDMTQPGPFQVTLSTYSVSGVTSGFNNQRAYFPSNIAALGPRPLVIVSHGNGHQYTWYNWLGEHLASYGYIVVSHQNNTQPGIQAASTTTLQHTQAVLAQQASIAGGALNGLIDGNTIVWIGHSRGGEGVVRAYDRIRSGNFVPSNYGLDDIRLVASIAPTDFLGTGSSSPGDVPFHLIYGAADGDVCGCPNNAVAFSFSLFERADRFRQSLYIHGTSHNDFHCCGINDFTGPAGTAVGKAETQRISKAHFLPLIKHVIEGDEVGREFLWRPYESLRPSGVSPNVVVVRDHRDEPDQGEFVIDDFQTNFAPATSSSGGAVTWNTSVLTQLPLRDVNTSFTWLATDPMNGMTRGRPSDSARGMVFTYDNGPKFLEFEVVPDARDMTERQWLAFRAALGTRHPFTVSSEPYHNFRVLLRDGSGASGAITLRPQGAGIRRPYARTGFGTGAGWQNEFQVVRLRISDFLATAPTLDLTDIEAIRFEFGGPGLDTAGRIALDDLRLIKD